MVIDSYHQEAEKIKRFLIDYQPFNGKHAAVSYTDTLMKIAHRDETSITIELDHVLDFDETLAYSIINNTKRYVKIFCEVIQELLPRYRFGEVEKKDFLDIYIEHRTIANQHTSSTETSDPSLFPQEILRRFDVFFNNITLKKIQSLREIKADSIGKLVTISGIITRCSDVKPLVCVATYVCDKCGAETYQPVGSSSFLPLDICPSKQCTTNKLGGRLYLQTRGSKFTKHQEIKIQEHSDHAPIGSVPRSMVVVANGNHTRKVLPGNHVQITGIFLPIAKTGFRQILQGLISDTFLEAHTINVVNKNHSDKHVDDNIDYDTQVAVLLSEPNLYEKLAYSISPEIYGHEDIKKALLLLLVGGVAIDSAGMKIRGSLNILLMGDPGVAKSQLLSYIDRLAYRSQLTTGKGSSGVGLTAAVVRDSSTGEFTLEGGALILSDQGVCCIDEFDKMDENDRTAIHEVMEQQTVSIAKAGISTTLNARVSILAAANPVYGRYNVKKSIEHNIQLPAALLSRFDLIWLIRDKVDSQNDQRLAQHIAYVHKHLTHPQSLYEPIPMDLMRKFLLACQKKAPIIPQSLMSFIVASYVDMRKDARKGGDSSYISARTLLSIIRLSTALARLRMADYVEQEDVSEAIRLIEFSKASILPETMTKRTARPQDAIYAIIRDLAASCENSIDYEQVKRLVMSHGYTMDQFEQCVNDYQELNVWLVNSSQTKIQIIS